MNDQHDPADKTASRAISAVRAGRLNEALKMLSQGNIEHNQLEETLRIYHAELHIQNDELKQSQRRIQQSEQRFARLFDSQPTPLLVLDQQGVVKASNQAARSRFNMSEGQFQGRFFIRMVSPDDQAVFVDMLSTLQNTQQTELVELALETPEGVIPSMISMARQTAIPDEDALASQYEVLLHMVDVSALKSKEAEIKAQSELLANVSDEVPGALMQFRVVSEDEFRFEYLSRGVEQQYGLSREVIMASPHLVYDHIHPDDLPVVKRGIRAMYHTTDAWEGEFRVSDGAGWRWLQITTHPKHHADGSVSWYGYQEDITDRRESTRLLISHARRAAMGDMLTNITHQWKQPLNALQISMSNLEDAYEMNELDDRTVQAHIENSRKLIAQMDQTIQDFVQFFRPNKELDQQRFEPVAIVDQALDLLLANLGKNGVETRVERPTEPLQVKGQPTELLQVIMILLQNAQEAMLERGTRNPGIDIQVAAGSEHWLTVKVTDNAGGIDEAHLATLFDPYFTTKENGSGIGLYLARLVVESTFGGTIQCQCENDFTTFILSLPRASS